MHAPTPFIGLPPLLQNAMLLVILRSSILTYLTMQKLHLGICYT